MRFVFILERSYEHGESKRVIIRINLSANV